MSENMVGVDISRLYPEITLLITAILLFFLGLFLPSERRRVLPYLGLLGLSVALLFIVQDWGKDLVSFNGSLLSDNFSLYISGLLVLITGAVTLISASYLESEGIDRAEYYGLLILGLIGMIIMVRAGDLLMIFLGLEIVSISIYILSAFLKEDPRSGEASLKYFLLGAFSSAFFIYGIAFVYGSLGTTGISAIRKVLEVKTMLGNPLLFIGLSLILVGFAFKLGLVPFHMWVPDLYEGAPIPVAAFVATAPKVAGFATLLRVLFYGFEPLGARFSELLWVICVLTMTLGNIVAISQKSIIRMLAYSSIAHAGYITLAVLVGGREGIVSVLFYLLVYSIITLGAFSGVILYAKKGKINTQIEDYSGLAYHHPLLALSIAIFMFALAGFPPTAGFIGKFYIFRAAIREGFIFLAIIGVLNSLVSVFYYLRVTVMMYMREPQEESRTSLSPSPLIIVSLVLSLIGTMGIGLFPSAYLDLIKETILKFV